MFVNGTLGKDSMFDAANTGLESLQKELGKDAFEFEIVELGDASSNKLVFKSQMYEYCDGSYDVIICGDSQALYPLTQASGEFADQKFIFFDEKHDFKGVEEKNIDNLKVEEDDNVSDLIREAVSEMMKK